MVRLKELRFKISQEENLNLKNVYKECVKYPNRREEEYLNKWINMS
jgi:hypothetical protein